MDLIHIAKVYADALLEISEENKTSETIEKELEEVSKTLTEDTEVWEFVNSPLIKKEDKIKVIEKAFLGNVSETMNSALYLLLKNERISLIKEIKNQFSLGTDKLRGRIRAYVESARALSDSEANEIKSSLKEKFKGECILENIVKPELIGGIIIKFNDNLIDGSMQSSLFNLKQNLLQSKLSGAYYEN
jgi:F-type H+-transporting ATPase subunit delta